MSSKSVSRKPFDEKEEEAFENMYNEVIDFERYYRNTGETRENFDKVIKIISTFTQVLASHENKPFLKLFYGITANLAAREITIDEAIKNIKKFSIKYVESLPPLPSRGGRRNKSKYAEVKMKDIKELCKANNIKLSRVVNDKRVVYKKKELLTKLKRKKII